MIRYLYVVSKSCNFSHMIGCLNDDILYLLVLILGLFTNLIEPIIKTYLVELNDPYGKYRTIAMRLSTIS